MTYTRVMTVPGTLYYAAIPTHLWHTPGDARILDASIILNDSELLVCLASELDDDYRGWSMCLATTKDGPRIGWVNNDNLRWPSG